MKYFIRSLLFLTLSLLFSSCYLIKNAYYLNNLYSSRRKIDDVLKDEKIPEKTKAKLRLVFEILTYAKQEGLNTDDKYSDYIDIGDRPISYIVEAAAVDELRQVTWWFPIVGNVPYLGYLEKSDRDEKAKSLKEKGFDIYESEAEAFSGLGWFRDPILSSYLNGSDASLSNLLFHELTHATVWIPGSVQFNENLASYVGDVLTIQFLESRKQTNELNAYLVKKADRERFSLWLQDLQSTLETLYKQRDKLLQKDILVQKKQIFDRFLGEKRPKFSNIDYIGRGSWNNAVVLAASLYISKAAEFAKARACLGNLNIALFLKKLKDSTKEKADPFHVLQNFCVKSGETNDK